MTTADVEGGGPLPEKKPVEEVAFLNGKNDQVRGWMGGGGQPLLSSANLFFDHDLSKAPSIQFYLHFFHLYELIFQSSTMV